MKAASFKILSIVFINFLLVASCKKKDTTPTQPQLSASALHSVHITSNAFNELFLNGTQFWTDANNNKQFSAKGGDILRATYNGGFLNIYIDGSTNPTLSSTGTSGTLTYTFQ